MFGGIPQGMFGRIPQGIFGGAVPSVATLKGAAIAGVDYTSLVYYKTMFTN